MIYDTEKVIVWALIQCQPHVRVLNPDFADENMGIES